MSWRSLSEGAWETWREEDGRWKMEDGGSRMVVELGRRLELLGSSLDEITGIDKAGLNTRAVPATRAIHEGR
jgi:hypothetical protein